MLLRNDLLEYTQPHPHTVRILWIDSANTLAYTFELNAKSAHPEVATMASLVDDVRLGRARLLLVDPYLVQADHATLPASHLEMQARALAVVSAITAHEPAIFSAGMRGPLVQAHSAMFGVSYPSVYRYLRRYWERGQNADALLPDYKNSGAPGKTRGMREGVKRGRPRADASQQGLNADAHVRGTFRAAVARYAATHQSFSRRGAYRQMLEDFFSEQAPAATPTFGQFNYWIEKDAYAGYRQATPRASVGMGQHA